MWTMQAHTFGAGQCDEPQLGEGWTSPDHPLGWCCCPCPHYLRLSHFLISSGESPEPGDSSHSAEKSSCECPQHAACCRRACCLEALVVVAFRNIWIGST